MTVIIDTNVISDLISQDPLWLEWSLTTLSQYESHVVNPIVYAELCFHARSTDEVDFILARYEFAFTELPRQALFLAAQAFKIYRKKGGSKTAPLPDFFIGAHAEASGLPLVTRDTARYRTYFPKVILICPQ